MAKDLPACTGNDRAVAGPSGLYIIERQITAKEIKHIRINAALETFSTKNIADPTPDQLEYEERKISNIEAGELNYAREGARGNLAAHERNINRIEGPIETRNLSITASVSLDDYLDKPELNNATAEELEEAGIDMVDVKIVDDDNYAADL
jgi:hypothetical protein